MITDSEQKRVREMSGMGLEAQLEMTGMGMDTNAKVCCHFITKTHCNGHYNRTPDLGKCGMWWNVWDLARHTILDTKVLDRNVTWLTRHKDTS